MQPAHFCPLASVKQDTEPSFLAGIHQKRLTYFSIDHTWISGSCLTKWSGLPAVEMEGQDTASLLLNINQEEALIWLRGSTGVLNYSLRQHLSNGQICACANHKMSEAVINLVRLSA